MEAMMAAVAGCPKPSFTEQLQHVSAGGAAALCVFMLCIAACVIALIRWG